MFGKQGCQHLQKRILNNEPETGKTTGDRKRKLTRTIKFKNVVTKTRKYNLLFKKDGKQGGKVQKVGIIKLYKVSAFIKGKKL